MKAEDLKTKTMDELKKLILDTRKEQFNLRFQRSGGALENTAQMRRVRRNIARIKTFMTLSNKPELAVKAKPAKKAAAKKAPAAQPAAKKETTAKKAAPKKAAAKKTA